MMTAGKKIVTNLVLLSLIIFSTPAIAAAQFDNLPPDNQAGGNSGQFIPCSGTTCSACDLVALANSVIDWIIGIIAIIFAIVFVYAGFRLAISQGNESAKSDAKQKLTNALIGFLIVMGAWLLIDTLLRALVGDDGQVNGAPWSQIECWGQNQSNIVAFESDDLAPNTNTFQGTAGLNLGNIGTGNTAIVAYAQEMDARQCQYSQARRNGCRGNPGYTDCSDLVNNAFQAADCRSPGNTTANMHPRATAIGNPNTLRPGDAVVYRNSSNTAGHVVICMNNGCSQVIHARGRGAPDGRPATIPAANQITTGNGSSHYNKPGARVLRAADYCD